MYRKIFAAVAFALIILSPAFADAVDTSAPVQDDTAEQKLQAQLDQLGQAAIATQEGDFQRAYRLARGATIAEPFSQLPSAIRHSAYYLLGVAAFQTERWGEAHEALRISSEMEAATGLDWYMRALSANAMEDKTDAMYAVTAVARDYPEFLNHLRDGWLIRLALRDPDDDAREPARFDLVEALAAAAWSPEDPTDADLLWADQAFRWAERGGSEEAAAMSRRIRSASALMLPRTDRRLDDVTRAHPEIFDIEKAVTRELALFRDLIDAHPDRLALRVRLAGLLAGLGRNDEALVVIDEALALTFPADGSQSGFTDGPTQVPWAMARRARLLAAAGRWDEAEHQMERAARRPIGGGVNIVHTFDLASLRTARGDGAGGLEAINDLTRQDMSDYGWMEFNMTRACAAHQAGDHGMRDRALAQLAETWTVFPEAYQTALLCADLADEGADLIRRRLDDPAMRGEMLIELQDFRDPAVPNDFHEMMRDRWRALRDRPDVRPVIDQHGRIESQPFVAVYF